MCYGPEENPKLGLRAHRLYRFHPELLRTQVRALLAAAAGWDGRLRLMYPLVNTMDDWRRLSELTDAAVESLRTETRNFREDFSRGFLAETPAAVLGFARLIEAADFAGVGTNDLVQYLLAVDRSNANVANLYQPEHPVVLGVLREMVAAAEEAGKPLTICGEIASEHYLLPVLIGLGLTDLSVAVPALDEVRRSLAPLDVEECRSLAGECLRADGVEQVRGLLDDWHGSACPRERSRDGEVIDPVCGMAVDPEDTPYALEHQGQRYFFCRRRCMEIFRGRLHSG
jgi:phosphoenolpyruvate-protein kinase (PTS system EI component)/YHS domain-containing protein